MNDKILLDYSLSELENILKAQEIPKYRVLQLYKWLNKGEKYSNMSDIDSKLRLFLASTYVDMPLEIEKEYVSKDGTKKFLYRLTDGELIEGVLMNYKFGNTLCISTQIGCGRGCLFCASGADGLERNLTAGEILAQAVVVNKLLGGTLEQRRLTNIVLMGSGEPLDNYENVTRFFDLSNDKNGLNISRRNISMSTCGIVPNIIRLADDGYDVTLTISLHNSSDEERKKFMPVASIYSIKEIIAAAKYYFNKTGRRIIFEYCLIKGENHLDKNVRELKELLKGFPAHLNLILLNASGVTNSASNGGLSPCTRTDAVEFVKKLTAAGLSVSTRRQMGADIAGACGQLKGKSHEA
jgi:23S rRNA (adenine2503-C2)-methyltransferase